jgi:hypothetical protein
MKEYYTYNEILESCGISPSSYSKPNLTWETLTFQDMIDYYEGNDQCALMMEALNKLSDILFMRNSTKEEVVLGELWYDKEDFNHMSAEDFEDMIADYINTYFELQTYLVYAVTRIALTEEYHKDMDFDGYRIVAYGSMSEYPEWILEIKRIYYKFFK